MDKNTDYKSIYLSFKTLPKLPLLPNVAMWSIIGSSAAPLQSVCCRARSLI